MISKMYRSKCVCKHLLLRKLDILSSIRSVFYKKMYPLWVKTKSASIFFQLFPMDLLKIILHILQTILPTMFIFRSNSRRANISNKYRIKASFTLHLF